MSWIKKPSLGQFFATVVDGASHLSLRSLARRSGISPGELSRILSGERKKPNPQALRQLAPIVGVHPAYLLYLADILEEHEWRAIDDGGRQTSARENRSAYGPAGLTREEWRVVLQLRGLANNETKKALLRIIRTVAEQTQHDGQEVDESPTDPHS